MTVLNPCEFCDARCCKEHVITVTSFDILRIMNKTGKKFEEFAVLEPLRILNFDNDTVLECYENGMRYDYVLALKSHPCIFLRKNRCKIHEFAPLVCGCYPFNQAGRMLERKRCPAISSLAFGIFGTNGNFKAYAKQLKDYKRIVAEWNRKKGSKKECIKFIINER